MPLSTIENPAYLIPPDTYTLGLHRWSKSGKLVPILQDVPATLDHPSAESRTTGFRTGILIHNGTREIDTVSIAVPCPSWGKGAYRRERGCIPRFYHICTVGFFLLLLAIIAYIALRLAFK